MRGTYPSTDRPDLDDAVEALATAAKMPEEANMQRLREVGGYLVGAQNIGRNFGKQKLPRGFEMYEDGDWANELLSRKSTIGLVDMRRRHVITVKSNLQNAKSIGSCEAEFYAAVKALAYALFIRSTMVDCGLHWIRGSTLHRRQFSGMLHRAQRARKDRYIQTKWLDSKVVSSWRLQAARG